MDRRKWTCGQHVSITSAIARITFLSFSLTPVQTGSPRNHFIISARCLWSVAPQSSHSALSQAFVLTSRRRHVDAMMPAIDENRKQDIQYLGACARVPVV